MLTDASDDDDPFAFVEPSFVNDEERAWFRAVMRPQIDALRDTLDALKDAIKGRDELISDLVRAGRRALGASFDEPAYRALVASAPIETIRRMCDDFRQLGDGLRTIPLKPPAAVADGPILN